jgi:hypothetical protein
LKTSRFAEAKAVCERAIAENHVGSFSNTLVRIAYLEGDQAATLFAMLRFGAVRCQLPFPDFESSASAMP